MFGAVQAHFVALTSFSVCTESHKEMFPAARFEVCELTVRERIVFYRLLPIMPCENTECRLFAV